MGSRYLQAALCAEGPTDQRFLQPLLRRLCEDLCARFGSGVIEVGDVFELTIPSGTSPHATRVVDRARADSASWYVLFVHTDAGGDAERARAERFIPIFEELASDSHKPVAVIPVREMEAWTIVDGDALRYAFGSTKSDADLGVPSPPAEVERIPDPKKTLEDLFWTAHGGTRRRRRRGAAQTFLGRLGEQVSLDVLRQASAFQRLESDLKRALRELGLLVPVHR